jgi:tripartite-type tricarboxylate transporter receptor subunit TctC
MIDRRKLMELSAASAIVPVLRSGTARAQAWPNRFVRMIVPYPAGGGADTIARIVSARLSEVWGQQVTIENRGGAGGNLASEQAARAAPDGYTVYLAGEFQSTNRFIYPRLNYDPVADFKPVTLVVQYPTAIAVSASSPARTLQEFIALAKASGKFTFASPGHGTGPHLAGELFKRVAGIDLQHVPYRGAAPGIQDLIPGRVDCMFNNIAPFVPLMKEGQIRGLAITTAKRTPAVPALPTVAESGLPGFDVSGWYALFVPAKTPDDVVRKMHADATAILTEPAIKGRLEDLGLFVIGSTPAALAQFLAAEMDKWGPVIKDAGITVAQ